MTVSFKAGNNCKTLEEWIEKKYGEEKSDEELSESN